MGKPVQYGGQAVIEGVMMRGPRQSVGTRALTFSANRSLGEEAGGEELGFLKGVLDSGQELT